MDFENMNKKKIIFIVIAAIIFIFIVIMFLTLEKSQKIKNNNTWWELTIWWFGDKKEDLFTFVEDFKQETWNTQLLTNVESFDSWEEYNLALASAISAWKAPDVFILNWSEKSIFEEQVMALDPAVFDADKFKNDYKSFFVDKLIFTTVLDEKENKKSSFVVWIPVWYEQLWVFYNRLKWIQASDFDSWAALNKRIQVLKERRPSMVPLWIWRWDTVYNSNDIITQFLMLEWIDSLDFVSGSKLKSALSTYFMYADSKVNWYDEKVNIMNSSGKNNLDYFSRWEIAMVIWYPKMLLDIDKKGFRKSALYAKPFPWYFNGSGKSLVNYNYFVINKDAQNESAAVAFLQYLNSDKGALKYLEKFPYYLPARVSLEEDVLDMPIIDWYNIKKEDFNNPDLEKASFDKKVKLIYDREIVNVLDDNVSYLEKFTKMKNSLICKFNKIVKLEGLSVSCDK